MATDLDMQPEGANLVSLDDAGTGYLFLDITAKMDTVSYCWHTSIIS